MVKLADCLGVKMGETFKIADKCTGIFPHGERYELCNAVHAECNALLQCNPNDAKDSTLYLFGFERDDNGNNIRITAEPCMMCRRIIKNMRVKTLIGSCGTDGYYKKDLYKEN